jgi:hypothetical protein
VVLTSCAGSNVETSLIPPSLKVTVPVSEILSKREVSFAYEDLIAEKLVPDDVAKYQVTFYPSGFLRGLVIPSGASVVPLRISAGGVAKIAVYWGDPDSGMCLAFDVPTSVEFYQPTGTIKSIMLTRTGIVFEFTADGAILTTPIEFQKGFPLVHVVQCGWA